MVNTSSSTNHPRVQIEIRKAKEEDLLKIISMLTPRMLSSVENSYITEGISDKEKLTGLLLKIQIEDDYRVGEIWIAGDYQGVLTGRYGNAYSMLNLLRISIKQNNQLKKSLTKADLNQLNGNLKRMAGTQNMRWRKQVCGSAGYFYLQLVAIDSSLKGSGVFRQLVEPVLKRLEHERLPVCLDTHDKNNIPIYEHFGFELVKKHYAKSGAPIIQYSMIKYY